ncbi:MAG: hypothetical protein R2774_06750 [Saprospiraceae bacterium]
MISCQKDSIIFIPDQTQDINQEVVFSKILGQKAVYTIPKLDGKYLSISNYLIKLDSNTLVDDSGKTINSNVRIEFNDAKQDKLNLIHSKAVIVDGEALNISHYFTISFSSLEGNLKIVKPITIFILTNTDGTQEDEFYTYNVNEKVWKNGVDQNNIDFGHWDLENDESQLEYTAYRILLNSSNTKAFCVAKPTKMDPTTHKIKCTLPSEYNHKNTLAYFVSNDSATAFPLTYDKTLGQFTSLELKINPKLVGDIVIFSDLGNDFYYFGTTNAVIADDKVYDIIPKTFSNEDIRAKMLAL